jgi:hypothetical protein
MSETEAYSIPDPVVRFRMRTLMHGTTVLAVLAALAGPFYRSVDADRQRSLLVFWASLLLCTGTFLWWRLREALRWRSRQAVRFVVYASNGKSPIRRTIFSIFVPFILLALYAGASRDIAQGPKRSLVGDTQGAVYQGFVFGMITSGLLFRFVRPPMFLTERGIPLAKNNFVPWHWIRAAKWMPNRPSVMILRRLEWGYLHRSAERQPRRSRSFHS